MKYIKFNNDKTTKKNKDKEKDESKNEEKVEEYTNLQEPNINDKNYIYWRNLRESARCMGAFPSWFYSDKYVTYFLTITFKSDEIKASKYEIEELLNSFVFKVDRTLQSRLKKQISRAIVFFEDSFYTSNSGRYIIPHIHAFFQIPSEYHEKFISRCITGSFKPKKGRTDKVSYILSPQLLDDKKSILTIRDYTLYLGEHREEMERWCSYNAKALNEKNSSFGYEDILIIQNTIKHKNRTLNNRTSTDGRYLPA